MRIGSACLLVLTTIAATAHAQTPGLLHELFQDHAVLQRDQPIAVFGNAAANEVVTVSLGTAAVRAQADAAGHWRATLPAMPAGGPFVMNAQGSSGARASASDLLLGDVFLCSGQSNMELPVLRAGDSSNEINISANNTIRMLTVPHATHPRPLDHFQNPVTWQIAAPATVPDWSAACFYFGRELQKSIHVPIGLVHSSWGGSKIAPWMSAAALDAIGGYQAALGTLDLYAKDPAAAQLRFADQWQSWWRARSGDRPGAEPWNAKPTAAPTGTTGAWRPAPPLDDWRNWPAAGLADFTGLIWYRTTLRLTAAQATGVATLNLGPINQIDQTWINGRAVGNSFGYGSERTYRLAAGVLHAGDNVLVINVLSTYGGGGLLAGGTPRALLPAAGPQIALDGPWQYRVAPVAYGFPPQAPWQSVGGLTTIYNAMIAPLHDFGLRGALWYQGESNTTEASAYQPLLTGLMGDWRRQFGAALAFLVVQLPDYGPRSTTPGESDWAQVREAERQAVAHAGRAGLAVTIDIGDPHNLHPADKQDVGRRLARAARHVIYGDAITASGPVVRSAHRSAQQVVVDFGDVDGALVAYSHDSPIGFELCGIGVGSCRYAEATLGATQVRLHVPDGAPPTRVRYCWADSPVCTLFDHSGLPAGPFEVTITP